MDIIDFDRARRWNRTTRQLAREILRNVTTRMKQPSFISTQVRDGRYVFLNLTPSPRAPLTVVCGGREWCAADYDVNRSNFAYCAVEYVGSGSGEFTLDDRSYPLRPGMVFAYSPRIRHRIRSTGRVGFVKYFVDFCGARAEKLLRGSALGEGRPMALTQTRWIQGIFDQMLAVSHQRASLARHQCGLLLELLLSRLEVDAAPADAESSAAYGTYTKCRCYIEDHFASLKSATGIAEACHLDPAYLSRLFDRFAGEGPYRYLIRLKMNHCADLMLRQNLAIKQAAVSVGYDDPLHFSRVFKRIYGLSPRRFVASIKQREA